MKTRTIPLLAIAVAVAVIALLIASGGQNTDAQGGDVSAPPGTPGTITGNESGRKPDRLMGPR